MPSQPISIASLGRVVQGITVSRYADPTAQERRILQVANLEGSTAASTPDDRFHRFDEARSQFAFAKPGQVLVSLRTSALRLRASVVPPELDGAVVSNSLTILDVDPSKVIPEFLAGLLRSETMQRHVAPLFTGATVQGIPLGKFKGLKVSLPDLSAQQAFVNAFNAFREYEESSRAALSHLQAELDSSLFPVVHGGLK